MSHSLQQLQDRIDIETVLIQYCRYIDRVDLDPLAALFTEDCFVEYGPDANFSSQGRAKLRRDLERMWRYRRTAHQMSNIEIVFISDDEAHALSAVIAWHELPENQNREVVMLYGRYDDTLVRTEAGWRIRRRKLMNAGGDRVFEATIYPCERLPAPKGWSWPPKTT
jgi:3-phenylpropionate/cinnamic acid dioxygenase small subunit